MIRKRMTFRFIQERTRSDRPAVDWVSADHYGTNQALIDKLEEQAPGILWALGVWTDIEVATRCDVDVNDVTRARRVIGAPRMTAERQREVERRIGPLCELVLRADLEYEAFRLRRWAAELFHLGKNRARRFGAPGEAWWTRATSTPKEWGLSEPIGARNCHTCRFWGRDQVGPRGKSKRKSHYCFAPRGIRRLIGRRWLHQSKGDIDCAPLRCTVGCPAWEKPVPGKRRRVFRHRNTDKLSWWEREKIVQHVAPWPFDGLTGWTVTQTPEWLALMDDISRNLR